MDIDELSSKILSFVIQELKSRAVLDDDAMENCFGCKSYDEVQAGIKQMLETDILEMFGG